jgi:hypothetical protein
MSAVSQVELSGPVNREHAVARHRGSYQLPRILKEDGHEIGTPNWRMAELSGMESKGSRGHLRSLRTFLFFSFLKGPALSPSRLFENCTLDDQCGSRDPGRDEDIEGDSPEFERCNAILGDRPFTFY